MPTKTITVSCDGERIPVNDVAYTEWTHDDTLLCYDSDDVVIAEFPGADYAVAADHLA